MSFFGSTDFLLEVAKGNVPGHTETFFVSSNNGTGAAGVEQGFWNLAQDFTYLSTPSTLFVSSTNAADTQTISLVGTDDNGDNVTEIVVLSGQTQVAVTGLWDVPQRMLVVSGGTPLGEIYLAESDTLTGGVPDTPAKIQMKIDQGCNIANSGAFMVPTGHTCFIPSFIFRIGKGEDATIKFKVTPPGVEELITFDFNIFESQSSTDSRYAANEAGTKIRFTITPGVATVRALVSIPLIKVENAFTNLA